MQDLASFTRNVATSNICTFLARKFLPASTGYLAREYHLFDREYQLAISRYPGQSSRENRDLRKQVHLFVIVVVENVA